MRFAASMRALTAAGAPRARARSTRGDTTPSTPPQLRTRHTTTWRAPARQQGTPAPRGRRPGSRIYHVRRGLATTASKPCKILVYLVVHPSLFHFITLKYARTLHKRRPCDARTNTVPAPHAGVPSKSYPYHPFPCPRARPHTACLRPIAGAAETRRPRSRRRRGAAGVTMATPGPRSTRASLTCRQAAHAADAARPLQLVATRSAPRRRS